MKGYTYKRCHCGVVRDSGGKRCQRRLKTNPLATVENGPPSVVVMMVSVLLGGWWRGAAEVAVA